MSSEVNDGCEFGRAAFAGVWTDVVENAVPGFLRNGRRVEGEGLECRGDKVVLANRAEEAIVLVAEMKACR